MSTTISERHEVRVIALDLHDLLEDWAITRGHRLLKVDEAVDIGMQAVRDGATFGDAFERAKNWLIRG